MPMKQKIVEVYETEEQAKKCGEDLNRWLGYEVCVYQDENGKWVMEAETNQVLMG